MIRKIYTIAFSLIITSVYAQLKSPEEFLGYRPGTKFTRHHQVVEYFEHVADNSPMVKLKEYGKTYEERPLLLAMISSEENMANLENIRQDNLKRAGIMEGSPSTHVPIVWLSYNVHGNESNSTEASMETIYELLTEKTEWLENTLVIIDPCINPDGRDRYVNFFWQYGNQPYNPDPQSKEHVEPWPGGRTNHYYFDLNRDWAWQTQVESTLRVEKYNRWLPHIHVDFHEQGVNSPYYFAPAAEPYHEQVTDWQREFQMMIGKNHAKYFDENDWFYFTKQRFDLLYPSYGDTYPMFNGAIGMTYEQAGHGRAGLGIIKQEGDTLTLRDRIERHFTTSLSTVEITSVNADRVLSEFQNYYSTPAKGKYKTFVIKSDNRDKLESIAKWLDKNGIEYGTGSGSRLSGYDYKTGQTKNFSIASEDLVVSIDQPKSKLTKILFEPQTFLADSLTYDITAWAVPYIYGVEAYATSSEIPVTPKTFTREYNPQQIPEDVYAFVFKWNSLRDARFLASLLKNDIKVRFTDVPFQINGSRFDRGSLIVSQRDNPYEDFIKNTVELANEFQRTFEVIRTGFVDRGPDVGSSDISYLKKPKIALIGGEGTRSNEFGAMWYYFERDLDYPVSILGTDYFNRIDLSEYDVLVMQEGRYGNFGDAEMKNISQWVSDGGKLILFQSAIRKFVESEYAGIKRYNSETEKQEFERRQEEINEENKLAPYNERARRYTRNRIPGAIYRVDLDNTHPLAFGYDDTFFTLKTSGSRYAYLNDQNVGVIKNKEARMSGFVGEFVRDAMEESLVFGVENRGRGQIVYFVDNVMFRAFWYDGKLMVANALFFVGQ